MKKNIVCYAYISNNYDTLKEHSYIAKDWDYVCFTNNKNLLKQKRIGVWQIRKSQFEKLDPKRNSGWHKTHPHILFPEYEKSVWIDSNIDVLTNYLEKTVSKTDKHLLVPVHYERNCIYDEIKEVKDTDHDTPEKCDETYNFLLSENMPKRYGLNETNIMLRYHHDDLIKSIDELWWDCIQKYSKRDQLSFSYCLFKHGVKVEDISFPNARIDKKNYDIISHVYKNTTASNNLIIRFIACLIPIAKYRRKFKNKFLRGDNMKIFSKEFSGHRVHISFFGIKIVSYTAYRYRIIRKFKKTHKINLEDKNIVSLGMNCFPRTMLTKWGLKKSKKQGEPSYPFDLAIHFTKPLATLLNNNFDGFLNNFVFRDSTGFWLKPGAKGYWINKKYNFLYVHDEDCGENDKQKLVTRLRNRVKNWNKMIKDKKTTYFILYLDTITMKLDKEESIKIVQNIAKAIFKLRKGLPTKLVVWSTIDIKVDIDNVYLLYTPLPWKKYIWWTKDRDTVEGVNFEQRIAEFSYKVLSGQRD